MVPILDGDRPFLIRHPISKTQKISLFCIIYVKLICNILAISYKTYMWSVINIKALDWEDKTNMIILSGLLVFDTGHTVFMAVDYQRLLNFLIVPSTIYQGVTWMIPTLAAAVAFSHANKKDVPRPWVPPSCQILLVALDAFSGVGVECSLVILLQAYFVTKVHRHLMKQQRVRMRLVYYDHNGQPNSCYDYKDTMSVMIVTTRKKITTA